MGGKQRLLNHAKKLKQYNTILFINENVEEGTITLMQPHAEILNLPMEFKKHSREYKKLMSEAPKFKDTLVTTFIGSSDNMDINDILT